MRDDGVFEVGSLNEYVKTLIASDDVLASLAVRGEISNYKIYPSGHRYFTMKDSAGSLRCVMFKAAADKLRFKPGNGMKVIAFGRLEVYVRDGAYQLYASSVTPDGVGDLYAEYERLKEKLRLEGLFDASRKKPIPKAPRSVAVITSGAGAAVRDIIRVLGARWPLTKVIVLPVRVQGAEAPPEIAGAIKYCNRHKIAELIIAGRGGGSIEDLQAFNDERVARAIFASEIPVISAVGHEPDVTIADFAADLRAATPSNAAELAVPDISDVRGGLRNISARIARSGENTIRDLRRRLNAAAGARIMSSPENYLDDRRLAVDRAGERMLSAARRRISGSGTRFSKAAASLDALSPLKVLGRGYAIARDARGAVVRSAADVRPGDILALRLREDEISCAVN
ncbi:MAG: exodeoxyribonuclease VII large subunit [Oscillospiraceae bacterium]|jgi:exodeoxyribonuclease VII large subunit|nr:exodeoxyribonuclease VII large subunit [Oscillospiraceae bacterium]